MRFVALEKLINLHDGYRQEFRVDYHRLLLLQHEGERYVVEAYCPHLEHPLKEAWLENGELLWRESLPAAPVSWGLAVDSKGRIVVSLRNGQVVCIGG